ncbi:MAG: hypothetical protein WCN21_06210 [Comamonadaceae bacterium]
MSIFIRVCHVGFATTKDPETHYDRDVLGMKATDGVYPCHPAVRRSCVGSGPARPTRPCSAH